MTECRFCTKQVEKVADVRYCNVCKAEGRVPDVEWGDDWPIPEELIQALQIPTSLRAHVEVEANPRTEEEMPAPEVQSKSVLKRLAIQRAKVRAKVKAKAKNKPKKKRK